MDDLSAKLGLRIQKGRLEGMKEDLFTAYRQQMEEISRAANEIYVVNAGRMNHGKSSLFNSLLDRDAFKADDVRTTVVNQNADWKVAGGAVTLVDTPGLDARTEDNEQAYEAYRKATAIIFVHTVKTGELHRDELENLNSIRRHFPSNEYFWRHFWLVFTFLEEVDEGGMQHIVDESLRLIEEKCGGSGFPVFRVSNVRYAKGRREGKKGLVSRSGIPELRSALEAEIGKWRADIMALAEIRMRQCKEKATAELKKLRQQKLKAAKNKWKNLEAAFDRKKAIYEQITEDLEEAETQWDDLETEAAALWDEYNELKARHQREYY